MDNNFDFTPGPFAELPDPEKMCGRCYEEVDELFPPNCQEKSEEKGDLGMYHCPDCGAMILGGIPHPRLCKRCLDRKHPMFDVRTPSLVGCKVGDEFLCCPNFDCDFQLKVGEVGAPKCPKCGYSLHIWKVEEYDLQTKE